MREDDVGLAGHESPPGRNSTASASGSKGRTLRRSRRGPEGGGGGARPKNGGLAYCNRMGYSCPNVLTVEGTDVGKRPHKRRKFFRSARRGGVDMVTACRRAAGSFARKLR